MTNEIFVPTFFPVQSQCALYCRSLFDSSYVHTFIKHHPTLLHVNFLLSSG